MTRHNAILANMKQSYKIFLDDSKDTNKLRIAMVEIQFGLSLYYPSWVEMLLRLLRKMAPYAIIGRSPLLIDEVTHSMHVRFSNLTHKMQVSIDQYKLWIQDLWNMVRVEGCKPDIIVIVCAEREVQVNRMIESAKDYAEQQGVILLAGASLKESSSISTVCEMIRVHSADGDGHIRSDSKDLRHGIMTLGECVSSVDRPIIRRPRPRPNVTYGRMISGDSCAAVVAAGVVAMVLQQTRSFLTKDEWYHLHCPGTMHALLQRMGELDGESGLYWIKHWEWFGPERVPSLDIRKEVKSVLRNNPPTQRPPAMDQNS